MCDSGGYFVGQVEKFVPAFVSELRAQVLLDFFPVGKCAFVFGQAGLAPRARIEMNYTEAMKSLVAAGYGAAVLPLERPSDSSLHDKVQLRPLRPALTRHLGIAHRSVEGMDAATRSVLAVLGEFVAA